MLKINVKEGENIERALKRYKKKFERTRVVKEYRKRQQFTKPSMLRREEIMHAEYIEKMNRENE